MLLHNTLLVLCLCSVVCQTVTAVSSSILHRSHPGSPVSAEILDSLDGLGEEGKEWSFPSDVGNLEEYDIFTPYTFPRPEGTRTFYLYSPSNYTASPSPLPLVLFFHGLTDVCTQFITQFSVFALVAEQYQYHFGVMCGSMGTRGVGWNAGECCLFPNSSSPVVDDVAYTRTAVASIQATVQVQKDRIFAMGHSSGAFMSEALACNASDIFRGIASNAGGTILSPGAEAGLAICDAQYGKNATNILLIHGTADPAVPFNGTNTWLPSVPRDFAAWANRSHCNGPTRANIQRRSRP